MKILVGFLAIISISFFLFPQCVHASCPVPGLRPSGEYFKSDVVFTGTVISVRYADSDVGGWFYRLRVGKVFKGPLQDEFTVYTEDSSARFPLTKDETYLLFSYKRHGRLEIDNCGNSDLLSKSAASVSSIDDIPGSPPYGVIEGWVAGESAGVDVSGVRVIVHGHSKDYIATTDKNGWFSFRAPVGSYKVDFSSGEYYLNGGDDFWYDPKHCTLHAGETASLQFVSVRHATK